MGIHYRQCVCVCVCVCVSLYVCERETLAITLLNGASTPCEEGNVTEQGEVRQLLQ